MSKNYVLKIIDDRQKLSDMANEILNKDDVAYVTHLVNDLKDTLRANPDLCALAAPQIGQSKRVFCLKFANGDIRAFLNPMIISHSKELHLSRETNASIKDKEFIIPRFNEVTVAYQTAMGVPESNIFKGAPAEVFQQMCQLLDGILLDDYGLEVLKGFDRLKKADKEQIIEMYLQKLNSMNDELKKEINNNPDLKEIDNAINFMTDVALGKTKVEKLSKDEEKELNANIKQKLKDRKEELEKQNGNQV